MTYLLPIFDGDPDYRGGQRAIVQEPGQPAATITPPPPPTPAPAPGTTITATGPATAPPPVPTARAAPTQLPVPVVVGVPRFLATDYAAAAKALLPRGAAWSDDPNSVQQKTLLGIGKALERSDAALSGLLAGCVPGRLTAMLPEWEATLGLPDPCLGGAPSIDQRLKQVRGRFVGAGGQSRQHYTEFAAALGFTITITTYKPSQPGLPPSAMAPDSIGWMFTWGVTVTASDGTLPVDVLMCELQAIKPAETTLLLLTA